MFKNEEGFSLLELVVAVGVAGIIAAVALPTFAGLQDKATTTSATYAASASAAEALANSTMGTTGGASSSASAQPVTFYSADTGLYAGYSSGALQFKSMSTMMDPSLGQTLLASFNVGDTVSLSGSPVSGVGVDGILFTITAINDYGYIVLDLQAQDSNQYQTVDDYGNYFFGGLQVTITKN